MVADTSSEPDSVRTLSSTGAKARFGAAYVRAICCHAGVGFSETPVDEDVLAVDGQVDFAGGSVRVQIKCTGQYRLSGSSASWQIEENWLSKWQRSRVPVYFALVMVDPDDQLTWLEHQDDGTLHRAAAFWVRVDQLSEVSRIRFDKSQRLTADTLTLWAAELDAVFIGPSGEVPSDR